MSIFKSPLLIFGILLIMLTVALGVGPLFVNWDNYKKDFQREASLITGRQVSINGPLNLRLFPWPRLTAADVRISNPAGAMVGDLVRINQLEAEVAAAPLLSGTIQLRKVKLLRPVFSLERLATGGVNWALAPAISLKNLPGADQIAVSGIEIVDGQIFVGDGRRGGLSELSDVQGIVKAPSLAGPWRADISATQSDLPLKLIVSTSKYREGEPLKMSAAITPNGSNGFLWAFDGEILRADNRVAGKINIRPAAQDSGKENPLNTNWQVQVSANVLADFDEINFGQIEVTPANDLTGGNLITGSASIQLGEVVSASTNLRAAQLNLDTLVGEDLFAKFDGKKQLPAFSSLLTTMPNDTELAVNLEVASLISGGQTLSKAFFSGLANQNSLRIAKASVNLPGQTQATLSGVLLPAGSDGLPQLAGELSATASSLRDFLVWANPASAKEILQVWSGARGRASLQTQLGWTPDTFRLSGVNAKLDDATATGSFRISTGATPAFNLRLITDSINVDRYAPRGFSTSAIEDGLATGITNLAASALSFGDTQITVQTDSLIMHRVEAQDIAIDIDISEQAIELRTIEIGAIGDARLDIAGVINFPDDLVTGSISGDFQANDPRPFLRLAGLLNTATANTPWASRLGPVDLKILSEISTGSANNKATLSMNGKAAGATIALTGGFDGQLANWRDGDVQLTASATNTTGAQLLALAGITPIAGGDDPASLKVAFAGKPSAALSGSIGLEALSANFMFDGGLTVDPENRTSAAGAVTATSNNLRPLAGALGLVLPDWPEPINQKLDAKANVVFSKGKTEISGLEATLPLNTVQGNLALSGSLTSPALQGRLTVKDLDMPWLLSTLMASADGNQMISTTSFDFSRLGWLSGPLTIKAARAGIAPGFNLSAAQLKLEPSADSTLTAALSGTTSAGTPLDFTSTLTAQNTIMQLDGTLKAGIKLDDLFQTADGKTALSGTADITATVKGEGRTPGGLASQLTGTGKISAPSLSVAGFDIATLTQRATGSETVENLDTELTKALAGAPLTANSDSFDITIANGTVRSARVPLSANSIEAGNLRLSADLATALSRINFAATPKGELPSVSMRLSGHPQALKTSYNTTALKSWVSNNVLQKGIDRLEELQREEQRLIEEERKFREEQARKEAERQARLLAERYQRESNRRRAAEELERIKSATEARRRAAIEEEKRLQEEQEQRRLQEEEQKRLQEQQQQQVQDQSEQPALDQQRLQDLIEQNIPLDIPEEAIITPQNSGVRIAPLQPASRSTSQ